MLALGIAAALRLAPLTGPAIEWSAPPQCPSADVARAQIHELLGGAPSPETRVHVTIHEGHDAWVAEIDVEEAVVRSLQHRDCATLTEAAALVVAVALDPIRVADAGGVRSQTRPDAPPEIPEAPPPVGESSPRERAMSGDIPGDPPPPRVATPRLRHALRLGGGLAYAPVPEIAGALVIGHAVAGRLWRVETGIAYTTPHTRVYDDDGKGGRFQTLALDVRGCVSPGVARVRFPLCAGPSAGLMLTQGVGLEHSRDPVRGFVMFGVGGGVRLDVHPRVALWASGEASFGLVRPVFHVEGRRPLLEAPRFGGRGLLGVEIVFP